MIEGLRMRAIAKDRQGALPVGPAAEFVASLSRLGASAPYEQFMLEVNPIKWTRDAAIAVDGLIIAGSTTEAEARPASLAQA